MPRVDPEEATCALQQKAMSTTSDQNAKPVIQRKSPVDKIPTDY
jgi:hypothetical protein